MKILIRYLYALANSGILLCLPHVQINSNKYWKSAMNLSLPLLLAKNKEKKIEKLLVLSMISFVISLVILEVIRA